MPAQSPGHHTPDSGEHAPGAIEQFVAFVRRRVNRHRLWTALVWSVAACAGLLVVAGLAFVLRGYAVPRTVLIAALSAGGLIALIAVAWTRLGVEQSARFVDRFYHLHDAVASYLHFSAAGHRDGYYALQAAQTTRHIAQLNPHAVRYQPPRRALVLAGGLVALAIPISLRQPSPEVVERQRIEQAVEVQTVAAKKELQQQVERLNAETDDPFERELLKPEQLRQWVDKLEATKNHKDALRQFAQLERQISAARSAMQRRREEQLLDRAAEQLRQERATRELAEKLAQKQYKQAAEELDAMTPEPGKPASESRKALARLKAAAQRMAAAARDSRATGSGSSSASGSGASGAAGQPGGELSENLEQLEEAVAQLDESLAEAERQESQFGERDSESDGECKACQSNVESQLNKLCTSLKRLGVRRDAQLKLASLCKSCSQCQNGLCQCLNPGAKPGGKKAGWGSNTARRDQRDELADNGQTTQLRGIKGQGPSISTVEQADEGSGVSTRRTAARQLEFRRQLESFVQREDVPEQVKRGVKNYFQLIHQIDAPAAAATPDASAVDE